MLDTNYCALLIPRTISCDMFTLHITSDLWITITLDSLHDCVVLDKLTFNHNVESNTSTIRAKLLPFLHLYDIHA